MMLCDVVSKIEKRIPVSWAEEWDNPGLAVGDPTSSVSCVALALDVTTDSVFQAAANGCQLLVSHHPAIFHAMKSIVLDRPASQAIAAALQNGVALYAAHTNWDSSPEGVNFCLAKKLELEGIVPLAYPALPDGAWGIGAVGSFQQRISMAECLKRIKERWRLSCCLCYGDEFRPITKVAIGGGSCGSMWYEAFESGADVFITADMSYHQRQDALGMGLNIIVTDHGEMEKVSLPALAGLIEEETGLRVEFVRETPTRRILI
ncbi:MAG: Nif3-like dinuclear metal center hexameric protein [Synergistaceae bacterium]|nr:Nif3-like dinuclear metal center hexameric protein [Synergistaceae bacterium]